MAPGLFAFDLGPAGHERAALGAEDDVAGFVVAAGDVAAVAKDADAVGILVHDRLVVEGVAVLRFDADLPSAHAPGLQRSDVADDPGGDRDVVDQRLREIVAREPVEVIPVLQLVLHFVPLGLALAEHVRAAEIMLLDGDDLADLAVEDPLDALADAQVVAPAEPVDQAQVLLRGRLGGRHRPS